MGSARDELFDAALHSSATSSENPMDEAARLVDAYRDEVLREARAEVVAWLVKKAREHRAHGPQYAKQADLIATLADKVSRGAVRVFLAAERGESRG